MEAISFKLDFADFVMNILQRILIVKMRKKVRIRSELPIRNRCKYNIEMNKYS